MVLAQPSSRSHSACSASCTLGWGRIRPTTNISVRIAQYRLLLAWSNHPWYQRSFADDSWNTALRLLRLRYDAIEAGWQPNTNDVDYSGHRRLDALASVENLVRLGPDHD